MKNLLLTTAALTSVLALSAFDNGPGWKIEDGHVAIKDGNPVYIDSAGQEKTVAVDTISRLNNEAKTHREAKEAAEAKLKSFEGLDPVKAREALETVSKIDAKKLIDAGQVDQVRADITKQFETKLSEKDAALAKLQGEFDGARIDNVFANSDFIRNSVAVPRDMFEATFRNNFKVENGQVVAYDKAGNRLLSKEKAGEFATPEEALSILANSHSQKDQILKADVGSGSGSNGAGGSHGGARSMRRGEFEKLPPAKQAEVAGKINAGEMKLID